VLVGRASAAIDGVGWFYDDGDPDPGERTDDTDVVATVYVPITDRGPVIRRLVRTDTGLQWTLEHDGVPG
jgi:hypothetical protein